MPRKPKPKPKPRPKGRWCDDLGMEVSDFVTITVFEEDPAGEPTGLFDAKGNELYRVPKRKRIGFRG